MNKKIFSVLVVTLLMIATGITVAQTLKMKTNDTKPEKGATGWGWYNPAGAWVRSDFECFLILAPAGWGRYSIHSEIITITPTFYGYFPDAVAVTEMYGEVVATAKNTYDFTLMDYAVNEDLEYEYFRIWHGEFELTSDDTSTGTFYASIYLPNQDPFGGEEPFISVGPFEYSYIRIPQVPYE